MCIRDSIRTFFLTCNEYHLDQEAFYQNIFYHTPFLLPFQYNPNIYTMLNDTWMADPYSAIETSNTSFFWDNAGKLIVLRQLPHLCIAGLVSYLLRNMCLTNPQNEKTDKEKHF